jgi:hypothetical protein
MFKSQQYRAKATEYGELVKTSTSPEASREFQKLERRFASLADNEQVLADDHKSAVHVSNRDQSRGAALAVARFLHKHKNDRGCDKLTPTEDKHSDARLSAAALSRWDDEGGAVRDGLPM